MICICSLASPHLLSQPEKERLNTEFGDAGIIHRACILTLLDFHSLGPCPKFSSFFYFLLLEEKAVLYSVHLQ